MMDYSNESLSEIVLKLPMASEIFRKNRLDFCCGGKKSLKDACEVRGINLDEMNNDLNSLIKKDELASESRSLSEICSFIVKRYHEDLRSRLPELIRLAEKVERVHGDHKNCPKGLTHLLTTLKDEMLSHMLKEENILFPMIRAGNGSQARMPIHRMMFEHDSHGKELDKMHELTHSFRSPEGACTTWRTLYRGLEELEAELMEHIHLENNVLFPGALNS